MRLWLLEHPAVCSGLFQQYIFKQLFFNFNNFSGTSSCFRQQITDMAWTSCFIDFNSPGQTCLQCRPRTLTWPSWTAHWRYRKADTAEFFGGHKPMRGSTQLRDWSSMIKSTCLHVLIITRSDIIFAYTYRRGLTFLEVVYTAWEDLIDGACLAIFTSFLRTIFVALCWSLTPWCKTQQVHIYIDKFEYTGYNAV